jgi:hypothetical protein
VAATTTERWDALVQAVLAEGNASYGNEGGPQRAFGATSLKTAGKIFAMLVQERLVVKLPANRVDELVASSVGDHFDAGKGKVMREWLMVRGDDPGEWHSLTTESEAFVAGRGR